MGGGVIGTEYACMLAAVGVRMTLVESRPRLMEFIDDELGENLQFRHARHGHAPAARRNGLQDSTVDNTRSRPCSASNKKVTSETLMYCIGRQGEDRHAQPRREPD